ncbi:MAG: hypothetical protein EZS28_049426 [Streblomastix strix]|uniref:Uncharacterized protein n=1 Tax=Streblomastix strix TaxID=222440 RepID=A0A5J4T9Y9_9EUKA|nr:MAG: hypothetical protein EZS28_049426 [Streblomastix strix]
MKFARSLALAVCLGGGIEDNNSIIKSAKISFDSIIHRLIETLNEQQQYSSFRSCTLEEIEFEGGFEEFDAEDIQSVKLVPFTRFPIFTRIIVHIQQ